MKATPAAPTSAAAAARARGAAGAARVSNCREVEISQFWQYLHARLQPAVPKDRIVEPGSTCARGFFSMGSSTKPEERP